MTHRKIAPPVGHALGDRALDRSMPYGILTNSLRQGDDPTVNKDTGGTVSDHERWRSGLTVWLTGLPSSGKSTIANGLAARLRSENHWVEVLDGDKIRSNLSKDLGFSRADREENVRRIGFLAAKLALDGTIVVVSVIAPYAASRDEVRALHTERDVTFLEVHVATPVNVCAQRDVKGLYAKQRAGGLCGLTGVDDPYEPPERPDLRVFTHAQTEAESINSVYQIIFPKTIFEPPFSRR